MTPFLTIVCPWIVFNIPIFFGIYLPKGLTIQTMYLSFVFYGTLNSFLTIVFIKQFRNHFKNTFILPCLMPCLALINSGNNHQIRAVNVVSVAPRTLL